MNEIERLMNVTDADLYDELYKDEYQEDDIGFFEINRKDRTTKDDTTKTPDNGSSR
jgi:hypothetical protein